MYAYVRGEDEHFCFKWFKSRKEAEEWLVEEKFMYEICYTDPDYGVLTNIEFEEKFDEAYRGKVFWKRYGNQLRVRIQERK